MALAIRRAPPPPAGDTYYVSNGGNDSNDGRTPATAFATIGQATSVVTLGESILLERGSTFAESPTLALNGSPGNLVTLGAYGAGNLPVITGRLLVTGDYTLVREIDVDRNYTLVGPERGLMVDGADGVVLEDLTVQRVAVEDLVRIDDSTNVLVQRCTIQFGFGGTKASGDDSHGIAIRRSQGVDILDNTLAYLSGDCIQSDPDRGLPVADDIDILRNEGFTGPLPAGTYPFDWLAGEVPGENFLDVKVPTGNRSNFLVEENTIHGFINSSNKTNVAALNLKEGADVIARYNHIYDCEIGLRARLTTGPNAGEPLIDFHNNIVDRCEKNIRAEDGVGTVTLKLNTFRNPTSTHLQLAAQPDIVAWTTEGNAWEDGAPLPANLDADNVHAPSSYFSAAPAVADVSSRQGPGFELSDAATAGTYTGLTRDYFDGTRPIGAAYDVGASEEAGGGGDPNAHFNSEVARLGPAGLDELIRGTGYRTQAEIDADTGQPPNTHVLYNPTEDAAEVHIPANTNSLPQQVKFTYSSHLTNVGEELWVQFEARFDAGWEQMFPEGVQVYKCFQISGFNNDQIKCELKTNFSFGDQATSICGLVWRIYGGQGESVSPEGTGDDNPLSEDVVHAIDVNCQPGGDTWMRDTGGHTAAMHLTESTLGIHNVKPFLMLPGRWTRHTIRLYLHSDNAEYMTHWISDENNDPVVVIGRADYGAVVNPEDGFRCNWSGNSGFNGFWFEYNTSQSRTGPARNGAFFRNLIIAKVPIQLGGRPIG